MTCHDCGLETTDWCLWEGRDHDEKNYVCLACSKARHVAAGLGDILNLSAQGSLFSTIGRCP